MRFQIGDRVRHAIGTGIVLHVDNTDATLRIDFGCERIFWAHQRECSLCDALTFSFDEPPNFDERRAWWRQLTPIYEGVPAKLCCTPEILVSTFTAWECELSRVEPAPVTVEHNDDGWRQCDLSREVWLDQQNVWQFEFNGHDNHDFQLDDFEAFWLHRWPAVHAVVAQCEVTL